MNVIILAGGFGTRLYPLTLEKPKALLDIGGKPLLEHLMDNVSKTKPDSVLIVTNNRFYEQFVYWKSFQQYSFPIHVLNNGSNSNDERKGEVLDLFHGTCDPRVRGQDYLVLTSGCYFDYPLNHFILQALHHLPKSVVASYDIRDYRLARNFGVIGTNTDSVIMDFEERPTVARSTVISAGIYLFPKEIPLIFYKYLKIYKHDPERIGLFLVWLHRMMPTVAIRIEGLWRAIGDFESYKSAQETMKEGA